MGAITYKLTKDTTTVTKQIGLSTIVAITTYFGVCSSEERDRQETERDKEEKEGKRASFNIHGLCLSGASVDLLEDELPETKSSSTETSMDRGKESQTASPNAKNPEGTAH